ncbi:synaptobrevin family protein, putative [Ichthyophthirius multifiliis]|uniref:Synaptobrevin family protein, putative n=1 Tax=Ichthyophthirius multifiliis TaxID=5932 RepID=G0QJX8_ICHMU|nr:synaptobrevin family protein, putative [Ichthyophthirius multifiliis]EGR34479.1 synaptobrevin family protein, putative [Ichthyophthirius multifiliis]|eukprot:XP_004039783.1 synaptobrevin family protein, putative [Ichthyophthirius multifiliis]
MSIIYAIIARGKDTTLIEYTTASGSFPQISRDLVKNIQKDTKMTIAYNDKYYFHYINENNFTYMCLTESTFSKRNAFGFLYELQEKFCDTFTYDQRTVAINYSLNNQFADIIKKLMNQYSSDLENDKISKLKNSVNEIKSIIVENVDKLIDRQNRIELLVRTTSQMNITATNIKQQACQLRRETYWKTMKVKIMIGAAAIVGTIGFFTLI